MVPLLDEELTPKQKRYNEAHKKCRCTVERAIGVLKSRFFCKKTGGAIMYHESIACNIIVSCIVLHNYCQDRNLEYSVDDDDDDDDDDDEVKKMIRRESEKKLSNWPVMRSLNHSCEIYE